MRKNSRKRNKKNKLKNINTKKIIVLIIIIFFILIFSSIFALTNALSEKIIKRVKINDIDVSNLTINEAYQKLNEQFQAQVNKNITAKYGDYETTISLEQLEVNYDIIQAVNEAYKIGRNKNILISNYSILKTMLFSTKIEKPININEEELDKIIDDISAKIPGAVVESSYYIEEDNLIISSGKAGIQVKKEEFKNNIIETINKQMNGLEIECIEIPVEEMKPRRNRYRKNKGRNI